MSRLLSPVKYSGRLRAPMESLEKLIEAGGLSLVRAAFREIYFLDPEAVRGRGCGPSSRSEPRSDGFESCPLVLEPVHNSRIGT